MSLSAYQQIQDSQINYNYNSRLILLAEAALEQAKVKSKLEEIVNDFQSQVNPVNGVCIQFGQFVLIQIECRQETLVKLLRQLQHYVQKWEELPPASPFFIYSKTRTRILNRTVVLLYEENIRYSINSFRFICCSQLKNDITMQQSLQQQVTHTVAAMLKLTCLVNLCAQIVDEQELVETIVQLHDELPNMQNLCKILRCEEGEYPQIKTQSGLKPPQLLQTQAGVITANEEKYDAFLKEEGTIFQQEVDEVMELDEFIIDILLCNQIELTGEAAHLNENWVYENLKHILSKK